MHYSGFMDPTVPPPLQRILAFVNTLDVDEGSDEIDSPAKLKGWLRDQGLKAGSVTADDVATATELRESLRLALLANGGDAPAAPPATTVPIPLQVTIGPDGDPRLEPLGTGVLGALGTIVAAIPCAVADGTWVRAKVCPKDSCRWAFYDQSRNRSRRWCTMDVCGNREKTRSFRERQQGVAQD
jgi:predicted RNA-binding Zn ribbon-like protein